MRFSYAFFLSFSGARSLLFFLRAPRDGQCVIFNGSYSEPARSLGSGRKKIQKVFHQRAKKRVFLNGSSDTIYLSALFRSLWRLNYCFCHAAMAIFIYMAHANTTGGRSNSPFYERGVCSRLISCTALWFCTLFVVCHRFDGAANGRAAQSTHFATYNGGG